MPNAQVTNSNQWIDTLASFLKKESNVEAILVDQKKKKVSLATIGEIDSNILEKKLTAVLATLDKDNLLEYNQSPQNSHSLIKIKNLPDKSTLLEKPTCPTSPLLWKWRNFTWPKLEKKEEIESSTDEWRWLSFQALICGISLLLAWLNSNLDFLPKNSTIILYLISIISGGYDASIDAWHKIKKLQVDIHFLMLAVAVGSVIIGAWSEGALLLFLFSTSSALEHYALYRTYREIKSLTESSPKKSRLIDKSGNTKMIDTNLIKKNDIIYVLPDEVFPVDGEVIKGKSAVDESNLTGESIPISKEEGDSIMSGTLNLWGEVTIRTKNIARDSYLQKIINMIQDSQALRAPSQKFTDKFGTTYTYIILSLVTIMFLIWHFALGIPAFKHSSDQFSAMYRSMTLLVVASPCALVLSIPSAILAAIAWSAKKGILFRGGAAIERLANVNWIALDKTGTLTTGNLKIQSVESFPPGKETQIITTAFALESKSTHPIARAISKYAKHNKINLKESSNFQSLTGKGVRGVIDNQQCYLGRRELLKTGILDSWVKEIPNPPLEFTEVWVIKKNILGRILLKDSIRNNSSKVIKWLKNNKLNIVMLTGDNRKSAETIANKLEIDNVYSGLHPEEKVSHIKDLSLKGNKVAMIGDGVNDAPSLAASYVSISMGEKGSDAALEQSDIILMNDKIEKLVTAFSISKFSKKIIFQNLIISLGVIVIMIIASLTNEVNLSYGVLSHEGSTVIVCLNSLRLLCSKEPNIKS